MKSDLLLFRHLSPAMQSYLGLGHLPRQPQAAVTAAAGSQDEPLERGLRRPPLRCEAGVLPPYNSVKGDRDVQVHNVGGQ